MTFTNALSMLTQQCYIGVFLNVNFQQHYIEVSLNSNFQQCYIEVSINEQTFMITKYISQIWVVPLTIRLVSQHYIHYCYSRPQSVLWDYGYISQTWVVPLTIININLYKDTIPTSITVSTQPLVVSWDYGYISQTRVVPLTIVRLHPLLYIVYENWEIKHL